MAAELQHPRKRRHIPMPNILSEVKASAAAAHVGMAVTVADATVASVGIAAVPVVAVVIVVVAAPAAAERVR